MTHFRFSITRSSSSKVPLLSFFSEAATYSPLLSLEHAKVMMPWPNISIFKKEICPRAKWTDQKETWTSFQRETWSRFHGNFISGICGSSLI